MSEAIIKIDADVNAEVAVLHDEKIADDVQVDWAGVAAMELVSVAAASDDSPCRLNCC